MIKMFTIAAIAGGFSFAGLAADYQHCEVNKVSIRGDDANGNKTVQMTCFSGKMQKKWIANPFTPGFVRDVNDRQIEDPCFDALDEQRKVNFELFSKEGSIAGYCAMEPESVDSEAVIEPKDLAFFYMALKDQLVLRDVSLDGDKVVRASLSRHSRYRIMETNDTVEAQGMELAGSSKMKEGSQTIPEPLPSEPLSKDELKRIVDEIAIKECKLELSRLKLKAVQIENRIAKTTREKQNCGGTSSNIE